MGCNRIGKVIIVVNHGNVVIGKIGTIDPTTEDTVEHGAGSDVFSDQIRDIVNAVRDEISSIELPKWRGKKG
ncbi:hypothetical protein [Cohnella yongneupensis]|uniref:Uncharacterized protein n=1 Tax=Cohnella yongneupensis TaxID=425006 RepID=A0ABW0QSI6_9BACL